MSDFDQDELRLPNIPVLRVRCIEQLYRAPLEDWTEAELDAVGDMLAAEIREGRGRYGDWRMVDGLRAIIRDTEEYPEPIPKWVGLVGWLAPEGAVATVPLLVARIAERALVGALAAAAAPVAVAPESPVAFGPDDDPDDFYLACPYGEAERIAREHYGWPGVNLPDHLAADLADELYDVPDPRLINDD